MRKEQFVSFIGGKMFFAPNIFEQKKRRTSRRRGRPFVATMYIPSQKIQLFV